MSVDQYQRAVNNLDKEIALLETKKAAAEKKASDEKIKASKVTISKNASELTIKSKKREKERHEEAARKASKESADLQKKIADKFKKRNDAYLKLQKEQQNEQRKELKTHQQTVSSLQNSYENRILNIQKQTINTINISSNKTHTEKEEYPEYDAFISHAWEDKESFVDDFVKELENLDIKVWYDTSEIRWGDSMRQSIDNGLKKSRFGIVVLSPSYIAEDKYWTKAELDGLFQIESLNGKTLLPIWHQLTKKQIMDFSPTIANRLAMNTASMTAQEIAIELEKLLKAEDELET